MSPRSSSSSDARELPAGRTRPGRASPFVASGFFVLRTPLLPFDALTSWSEHMEAPGAAPDALEAALQRDRQHLRAGLRQWVEDPLIREALFIASPALVESLHYWQDKPDSEQGLKVERTLVRYFARMSGRSTPFGLFAGLSVGRIGPATRLHLSPREELRRHTRLDMDYVCALVEKVQQEPAVRSALHYVPNSSLYLAAGRLRYMEMRHIGRERTYHLVAVEPSSYLEATLARARGGASVEALAQALVQDDPEIELGDARDFILELIDSQVLVSTWAPTLTGPEPIPYLLEQSANVPALQPTREKLASAHEALGRIDAARPGVPDATYRDIARMLEGLPVPAELPRLFQVDMVRPMREATLSPAVVETCQGAVETLHRLAVTAGADTPIGRFQRRFLARYEDRAVPLLEALDEDTGIGFALEGGTGSGTGPLLQGFAFPRQEGGRRFPDSPRWTHLMTRLESCWRTQAQELILTEDDVRVMESKGTLPLPETFSLVAAVVGASAEHVDRGDFRVLLENLAGPSGAVMLGRFCHADADLEAATREHLRAEEALRPDALFAEVVHLPQGRMGNVICRPALRQHDLVFLGQSGVPTEQQIALSDLWLSVEQGRLVLRSRKLGREVIPRLTHAHNYFTLGLGAYRFLGQLQQQGVVNLAFNWGPLAQVPFLPRVVHGRAVLSLAKWNVTAEQLKAWGAEQGSARFAAIQRFRREARLPRWVYLHDGDNQLPIDLDNVLSVDTFIHLTRKRPAGVQLEELYPSPEGLCVTGPDGRYHHELVLPFHRREPSRAAAGARAAPSAAVRRTFPPGSEWLYAKLYTGTATADRLLTLTLTPVLRRLSAAGAISHAFFLRYGDPDWHVRVRLHGPPERLHAEALPALMAACASALDSGEGWKLQLDTYEREVERYGGPAGVELAEQLFAADSDAVLGLLEAYPGDAGASVRWKLALLGLDTLLSGLGLSLPAKLDIATRCRHGFGAEFHVNAHFEDQLSQRFRQERRELEQLLSLTAAHEGPWKAALDILERREQRLRPIAQQLHTAEREGLLTVPVTGLAGSFLHMHVNRMLPSDQRAQELILYDFLARLYRSRLARARKAEDAGGAPA
ncbi:Lanthionine biosynthesis protein LanB [Myxococcus hansupus]|uniref:Lanthionine biosynthesis protein LanB n=1 Tax=Pseudomyxococcus hansupus TaxID=1297742 RepID=A0A0H4WZ15_9BACT|nr:lantibiotic dehydratase [Myxococcus hansupus]AKQ68691.1 Lanthionine biosynthesis protein LanB [Myxococcus hansupus]